MSRYQYCQTLNRTLNPSVTSMTPTLFPAFDATHFDNVPSGHPDLHGVTYQRRAEEGEDEQHIDDGDGFVTVHADWDNGESKTRPSLLYPACNLVYSACAVKATLKEFNVLLRFACLFIL